MNSKNYNIIKLRYYTSDYYLKKFHEGDIVAIRKHYEAVRVWWHLHEPTTRQRDLYRRSKDE